MTYRERMERKIERRQEWAEKREAKARAAFNESHAIMDAIPMGQPIIGVKDRKQRDRAWDLLGRGATHYDMAKHHTGRAEGLNQQLERSIYSDDHDAIEKLEARIAALEAERDRWKRYNATARKGKPDESILDEEQIAELRSVESVGFLRPDRQMPSYQLQNLSGNIRRNKKRLEELKAS